MTSKKKETKEERLARKGVNPAQLVQLVTTLEGTFHQKILVKSTLKQHDAVYEHWRDFAATVKISPDIEPGSIPPSEAHLKGFLVFLASVTAGRIQDDPTVNTIYAKMQTFISTWRRRCSTPIPRPICNQVLAYFHSAEFQSVISLTTQARPKPVAHTIDVEILLRHMWADQRRFRTPRERVTCIALTLLQALTNDRPGAFTTSTKRPDCVDSILYRHCEVRIQPNPDEPRSPFVYIIIKINDIKNAYFDDSVFKYIILYPETDEARFMCPVTAFMTIFLHDDAFRDVHTAAEIFHPVNPPTHAYTLPFKSEWLGRPVCRRDQFDKSLGVWKTHPDDVVTYSLYYNWLRYFSMMAGFHFFVTPYCILITIQAFFYYKKYSQDRLSLKGLVAVLWLLELAHTVCITHGIYVATITWFGQIRSDIPDSFRVSYYFSSTGNAIVQAFYANRLARCFEKPYVAVLCWVLTICRFVSGVTINTVAGKWHVQAPHSWSVVVIMGFFLEAIVDLIITSSLCYFLLKSRRNSVLARTVRLLDKLIAISIPTGLLTCIVGIISAITGLTMREYDYLYIPLIICQAKLYSNSMLASLNSRSILGEYFQEKNSELTTCPVLTQSFAINPSSFATIAQAESQIEPNSAVTDETIVQDQNFGWWTSDRRLGQ